MKKLLPVFLLVFAASAAFANFDSDFRNNLGGKTSHDIKQYAGDLGLLIGMSDFHDGRAASFPGFDVGISANIVKPDNAIDDAADNDYKWAPVVYANAQLPILGLNVAARGTSFDGLSSLGGGVRWSLVGSSILPLFPDITASFFYDRMGSDYFNANHFSASISASVKVLMLEPYAGYGYDYTDLKVKDTGTNFDGNSYSKDGSRFTLGLNVSPIPFFYFYGAYVFAGDSSGMQAGLGARF
ncbi:hypothetical protein Emin_1270 [Elusimicrobium minutum Pei191]|uniref:Outer membrane protein beta-barrel domain-containing protein n=1 Tax=Elusimicrobium minutum (strain Pei191) TaxID=445932 RepID=B2KE74_ELUMP|nr:hypothetical protein [Elusimicrobium minutum]ACC98820.1 hypothetical protein Emin_1270 [Elusimicrobium minutum Pei191]